MITDSNMIIGSNIIIKRSLGAPCSNGPRRDTGDTSMREATLCHAHQHVLIATNPQYMITGLNGHMFYSLLMIIGSNT